MDFIYENRMYRFAAITLPGTGDTHIWLKFQIIRQMSVQYRTIITV